MSCPGSGTQTEGTDFRLVLEVFSRKRIEPPRAWSAGLSLVGWESGNDLVTMKSLGFESVGRLKVWLRKDPQPD